MARASSPRRALAPVTHEPAPPAPIEKLLAPLPRYEPGPARDDVDVRMGVVVGLGLDYLAGRTVDLIAEARLETGDRQTMLLRLALRHLEQACLQAEAR